MTLPSIGIYYTSSLPLSFSAGQTTRKLAIDTNEETIYPESRDAPEVDDANLVSDDDVEIEASEAVDAVEPEEVETETEITAADDADEDSSPSKGAEKRIGEITKARREAEREALYWKQLAQDKQVAPEAVEPGKTLADFDYDEKGYAEYLTASAKQEAVREVEQRAAADRSARIQAEYTQNEVTFAKKVDDYHQSVQNPELKFSPEMATATQTGENGPALRYYLSKHPEVSASLAGMNPWDMARELGKIEATKLNQKPAPKLSKAPEPPPKLKGSDNKVTIDPAKMTDSQFAKWRQKQIANR